MSRPISIGEQIHRGVPVSGGIARAQVVLLGRPGIEVPRQTIEPSEAGAEWNRLEKAVAETRREIEKIQKQLESALGAREAEVFDAQLLVLEDATLLSEVRKLIYQGHLRAECAVSQVLKHYVEALSAIEDEYLRERSADVRDVGTRLLGNLLGVHCEEDVSKMTEPCILVAHDLSPSTTAQLDRRLVQGFATEAGGKTSHTAIMARKLGIPAVVGLAGVLQNLRSGDDVLLDGHEGLLVCAPTDSTLYQYGQLRERRDALERRLKDLQTQPAVTLDGIRITLSANIEGFEDVPAVKQCGAEGVGLFRTEFLFLNSVEAPSEDRQYEVYRRVAEELAPASVIIRTLDLGGDKLPATESHLEANPFLGWRAIRICLERLDLFRTQLRAILRASAHGNIRILYPMISSVDELRAANRCLEECREQLRAEGIAMAQRIDVGVMIEIPSAALIADTLAREVQFFSIGTNDLTQYTLAVDRLNEHVAPLYAPTHPGVLRLIRMTVDAARKQGIWVGVCGEAAGDPSMIPLLIGLGVEELSAAPAVVPQVKFLLRRLRLEEVKKLAEKALECATATETLNLSKAMAREVAPDLWGHEEGNK